MATLTEIKERFDNLNQKQKIAFGSLLAFSLAVIIFSIFLMQKVDYQVLYSHIGEEELGTVMQRLKDLKVPYKVDKGSILVPSDKVYELRLQLASEGIPQTGGVGFELFDKTNFAMTDFVQKLNYKRALQGELARSIKTLPEVEQVRVHLTIPEKTLFATPEEQTPKASVMLKLKQGKKLTDNQILGIINLVASSVEGLEPKNVTVVNQFGQLLTKKTEEGLSLTNAQLEIQKTIEKELENKVVNLIEPVVGKNKVRAKVSVELDFSKVEKTEEVFNPESKVVRSEQRNIDKSVGAMSAGVPGVASNLPTKTINTQASTATQGEKSNEIVNYEISKYVSKIVNSPGTVKRLTVVALVDGNYQGSDKNKKYIPRTDEEIKKFEDLVKNAVGFNEERGDDVRVVNMPFSAQEEDVVESKFQAEDLIPYFLIFAKYSAPILSLLILYLFVIRPLLKVLAPKQPDSFTKVAKEVSPEESKEVEDKVELTSKEKIPLGAKEQPLMIHHEDINAFLIEWAKNNPKDVVRLIKKWVNEV
jgi:flagellar M-ring protein FliF